MNLKDIIKFHKKKENLLKILILINFCNGEIMTNIERIYKINLKNNTLLIIKVFKVRCNKLTIIM